MSTGRIMARIAEEEKGDLGPNLQCKVTAFMSGDLVVSNQSIAVINKKLESSLKNLYRKP